MSQLKLTTLSGYVRDFSVAVVSLAMLFGLGIDTQQAGGILLLVMTALALGTHIYGLVRGDDDEASHT